MNVRALTKVSFWAAIGLVVGFFLPWFSQGFVSISGYQTSDVMRQHAAANIKSERAKITFDPYARYTRPRTEQERTEAVKNIQESQVSLVLSYALYAIPLIGVLCALLEFRGTVGLRRRLAYLTGGCITLVILGLLYNTENADGQFFQQASIGIWLSATADVVLLISVVVPGGSAGPKAAAVAEPLASSQGALKK